MKTVRGEKTSEEMAPLCWVTTSCWPLSRDASHMPPDYPRGTTRADWRLEPVVTREGPGCLFCARAAGSAGLLSNRLQGGMSDHLWRFKVKLWVQWATSISNNRHHFDPPSMRWMSNRQFALRIQNGLLVFFIAVLHKMSYEWSTFVPQLPIQYCTKGFVICMCIYCYEIYCPIWHYVEQHQYFSLFRLLFYFALELNRLLLPEGEKTPTSQFKKFEKLLRHLQHPGNWPCLITGNIPLTFWHLNLAFKF